MGNKRKSQLETDLGELVAGWAVTALLSSYLVASVADGCLMQTKYEKYVSAHCDSKELVLSYREYVERDRKEHPIVGRFYGLGRSK